MIKESVLPLSPNCPDPMNSFLLHQRRSIHQLPRSPIQPLSPEHEDGPLNLVDHPKGTLLPDSFPKPIIKTEVLINQESPHEVYEDTNLVPRMVFYMS